MRVFAIFAVAGLALCMWGTMLILPTPHARLARQHRVGGNFFFEGNWFLKNKESKECRDIANTYLDTQPMETLIVLLQASFFQSYWKEQGKDMALWEACFGERIKTEDKEPPCKDVMSECEGAVVWDDTFHGVETNKPWFDSLRKCFEKKGLDYLSCI